MDNVNPPHYKTHASGVECIQITRHMTFNLGNVVKYLWRAGLKTRDTTLEDLRKAAWYLDDEIKRVEREQLSAKQKDIDEIYQQERVGPSYRTHHDLMDHINKEHL